MIRLLTIIAALALTLAATPAFMPAVAADESVSLRPFNLSNPTDIDRLHREIVITAKRSCEEEYRFWPYKTPRILRKCLRHAVDRAIGSTNLAALQRLHASIRVGERYDPNRALGSAVTVAKQD